MVRRHNRQTRSTAEQRLVTCWAKFSMSGPISEAGYFVECLKCKLGFQNQLDPPAARKKRYGSPPYHDPGLMEQTDIQHRSSHETALPDTRMTRKVPMVPAAPRAVLVRNAPAGEKYSSGRHSAFNQTPPGNFYVLSSNFHTKAWAVKLNARSTVIVVVPVSVPVVQVNTTPAIKTPGLAEAIIAHLSTNSLGICRPNIQRYSHQ